MNLFDLQVPCFLFLFLLLRRFGAWAFFVWSYTWIILLNKNKLFFLIFEVFFVFFFGAVNFSEIRMRFYH